MRRHSSELHEGDRDPHDPQGTFARQGGCRRFPLSQKKATVPEEAPRRSRMRSSRGLEAPRNKKPDARGDNSLEKKPRKKLVSQAPPTPAMHGKQLTFAWTSRSGAPTFSSTASVPEPFFLKFLACSTSPSRGSFTPSSSVFPLPVPPGNPFERMPPDASSRRRRSTLRVPSTLSLWL